MLLVRMDTPSTTNIICSFFKKLLCNTVAATAWNVSKYEVFSGPYFLAFGLNTERYSDKMFSFEALIRVLRIFCFWGAYSQKQPFADDPQERCCSKFRRFRKETPALEYLSWRPAALLRRDSKIGVFLWNLWNF